MPHKVNETRRHRILKARYKIENWAEHDAARRRRGSLTLWMTPEAIAASAPASTRRRGRPRNYSGVAIETGLMLRFETLIDRSPHARTLPTHKTKTKTKIACKVLNIMTSLGMPVSRRIA